MAAPFEVGEVVECFKAFRTGPLDGRRPQVGQHYRVLHCYPAGVAIDVSTKRPSALPAIVVFPQDFTEGTCWNAGKFRRLNDEQYPEVLARIKGIGQSKPSLNPARHSRELHREPAEGGR